MRSIPSENTKNKPLSFTFSKILKTWSFHVVVLQRTAKKCTKNYNARAQLLFCSLNLLFCGVLVAVAVVVCLRSLMSYRKVSYPTRARGIIVNYTLNIGLVLYEMIRTSKRSLRYLRIGSIKPYLPSYISLD